MATQKALSLDSSAEYDYHLEDTIGDREIYDRSKEVGQHIRQRLRFYRGEWAYDLTAGVPWFQHIFKKPFNKVIADSLIKKTVLQTPGVTKLIDYKSSISDDDPRRLIIEVRYSDQYLEEEQELTTEIGM